MASTATDYDAGERREQLLIAQQAQERLELREIMSTPVGRRFIGRMLERTGVFTLCFAGADTQTTAFNLGQRNVGLALMADLESAALDYYFVLLKERQVAQTAADNAGAETAPS